MRNSNIEEIERAPRDSFPLSPQRFYEAPLVANVSCSVHTSDDDGYTTTLRFTAWNSFKQQGLHQGTYKVFDHSQNGADGDETAVRGTFGYVAHWRPSVVVVDLSSVADAHGAFSGLLAVENEWGGRTAKHVACATDESDDSR